MYQYTGFAAAGSGHHEHWFVRRRNRLSLSIIQRINNWCYIHVAIFKLSGSDRFISLPAADPIRFHKYLNSCGRPYRPRPRYVHTGSGPVIG